MQSAEISRRQFLGGAASTGLLATVGTQVTSVGAYFAPAFVNCDKQFFAQLDELLSTKPTLRLTLFLTVQELHSLPIYRQVEIGYRPNHPNIRSDFAQWRRLQPKPTFATAEQGALWSPLTTLCAEEGMLLASWGWFSEQMEVDNPHPLFDGSRVNLADLFGDVMRSRWLARISTERLTPLRAL